jgi:hypothetical protein
MHCDSVIITARLWSDLAADDTSDEDADDTLDDDADNTLDDDADWKPTRGRKQRVTIAPFTDNDRESDDDEDEDVTVSSVILTREFFVF